LESINKARTIAFAAIFGSAFTTGFGLAAGAAPATQPGVLTTASVQTSAPLPPQPTGIAAIVDGKSISVDDVRDRAYQIASRKAVEGLIDNMLIDEAAKKAGIAVTDAEVDAEKQYIERSIAPQSLAEGLKEHDMTMDIFDDVRRHDLELRKLILRDVKPERMVHVREIYVHFAGKPGSVGLLPGNPRTEAEALAIVKKAQDEIKAGHTFADVAARYDEDPDSKSKSGDAGVVYDGSARDPRFNTAALALTHKGDVTPAPVRGADGYYLIQLVSTSDDHTAAEQPLYDDATDIWQRQQTNLRKYQFMVDLRSQAHITNWVSQ
jgi:parvulin-like peptidyl-prolyl isomerase